MVHPHAFFRYTPPFVPVPKSMRPPVPRKTPPNWPLKPAPKTGLPGTSNSRQSRPLPQAPLREVSGAMYRFPGLAHPSVLRQKFPVLPIASLIARISCFTVNPSLPPSPAPPPPKAVALDPPAKPYPVPRRWRLPPPAAPGRGSHPKAVHVPLPMSAIPRRSHGPDRHRRR